MRRGSASMFVLLPCLALLAHCSFDRSQHAGACGGSDQCAAGEECYRGFCVAVLGGGLTGMPCESSEEEQSCFDGAPETLDIGACKAGSRSCVDGFYTACVGQVLAQAETCNGVDDDCNDRVDDLALATCATGLPGACSAGTPVCQGALAFCQPSAFPATDICNGLDDDCDGAADDVSPVACYPAQQGCTIDAGGRATCTGLCRAGVTQCEAGEPGCSGAVTPSEERCTGAGQTAADEDCDGEVDEACPCNDGETLPCYSGPEGTAGQGACHGGVQACANQAWGVCQGEVTPETESCANPNSDDDCNGQSDDIPGLNETCYDEWNAGICRDGMMKCGAAGLSCVTREAEEERCDAIDQDCDGNGYNGFDLSSLESCGPACERCEAAQVCCAGACKNVASFATDAANCGACGNRCGASQYCCQGECVSYAGKLGGDEVGCDCDQDCGDRSCCGRQCLDLSSDEQNCGGCGIVCSRGTTCCKGACRSLCLAVLGIEAGL